MSIHTGPCLAFGLNVFFLSMNITGFKKVQEKMSKHLNCTTELSVLYLAGMRSSNENVAFNNI